MELKEGPQLGQWCRSTKEERSMTVKGFLLKDREDQEYLLAIQPATHGMFERLIVRQKVDGCWVELNGNTQGTWQPRTHAITAVLGYLQRLWDTSKPVAAREH